MPFQHVQDRLRSFPNVFHLDCDAFQCFKEEGLLNKETGKRYRQNILEKGSSDDLMKLYRQFRGSDPKPEAMLRNRGLID